MITADCYSDEVIRSQ